MENQVAELITDAVDVLSAIIQSNTMVRYPTAVRLMLQKAIALFPKYQAAVQGRVEIYLNYQKRKFCFF
jgi:hypothetical protein